ncbi:MAG: penicillin-binding protein 2 [Deltaproteobacteria bacterium]|nr:penicillin-binding protein 2 [Deltaproteobacteria bacterium]
MRRTDFDPVSLEIFYRQLQRATLVVLAVFALLVLRLWFLQIVNGWNYRAQSENNRIHLQDIPPFRGLIFDRHGRMLVDNRPAYDLCLIPEEIQDRRALFARLKRLVGLDPALVKERLREAPRGYPFRPVRVKRGLSRDDLAVIETHRFNLPGVTIRVAPQRVYLYGALAAHVLGYLGEISDKELRSGEYPENRPGDLIGKSGVELRWNRQLNGIRGGAQVEVDAAGRRLRTISRVPPTPGANLYLTLDFRLQRLAERLLEGKRGAVVAMDPRSGEILAMASSPAFDPNRFIKGIDKKSWERMVRGGSFPLQNRATAGQYPPGSVFKIVVAVAALEEGVVTPEEKIVCHGSYTLGNRVYRCWKKWGHGAVDFHRAVVESCDVYFYELGKRLGVDRIARYARMLGLGSKTGLDLGGERPGLIPTTRWKWKRWGTPWQGGETLSTAIGQSFVLATPIQAANLIATIFNGGNLYVPQVTRWLGGGGRGALQEFRPVKRGKAHISPKTLALLREALTGVVNEPRGTGSRARVEGVTVAGKTGTAQVVAMEREKVRGEKEKLPPEFNDHAWFVAAAPAENPLLAVAVLIENGGHGGSAAAPIAGSLMRAFFGSRGPEGAAN